MAAFMLDAMPLNVAFQSALLNDIVASHLELWFEVRFRIMDNPIFYELRIISIATGEKSNPSKNEKCPAVLTEQEMHDQDSPFEKAVMTKRTKLDFTEKLWVILKDCSSTEELIEILTFVYNSFDDFIARPFVFEKNKSTIALDVKNMKEKLILCPVLEPKTALKLLLEVGIEKMRRDYATIFLSLELIPHECMSYYHQFDLLSLESITCLRKLHCVLELAIVCLKYLSLPSGLLSAFVRNTLKHYTAVPDIDFDHVFSFQIPTIKARQLLDLMRPTIWELTLTSSGEGFMKQNIHFFKTTPVHEHIYAPKNYSNYLFCYNIFMYSKHVFFFTQSFGYITENSGNVLCLMSSVYFP
ncbi:UNVERIFIED_CONTAM: zwilch [Trichonephila clavipes]